jgi:hypothetical protein
MGSDSLLREARGKLPLKPRRPKGCIGSRLLWFYGCVSRSARMKELAKKRQEDPTSKLGRYRRSSQFWLQENVREYLE